MQKNCIDTKGNFNVKQEKEQREYPAKKPEYITCSDV